MKPFERNNKELFYKFIISPKIDRIIALLLGGYWLYQSTVWALDSKKGWPLVVLILNAVIKNLLTIIRKPPVAVSIKISHWLVAILACNWWVFFGGLANQGSALISPSFASAISTMGLLLSFATKISLWRSFGVIPAKRQLRTTGMYSVVRHPMYAVEFLLNLAFLFGSYSEINLLLVLGSTLVNIGQALAEEDFFKFDEEYQRYKRKVKKRFVPYVV